MCTWQLRVVHPEHVANGLNEALPVEFVMKCMQTDPIESLSNEIDMMVTTTAEFCMECLC